MPRDRGSAWSPPAATRYFLASLALHGLLVFIAGDLMPGSGRSAADRPAGLAVTIRPRRPLEPTPHRSSSIEGQSNRRHADVRSAPATAPASVPATPTITGTTIDLDAARAVARETSRDRRDGRSRDREPETAPIESPLAQGVARSARPDCRQAHAGWGLFAIPLLLADTVTDRGCKW